MLETELYPPVKAYLEDLGYQVQAEVKHCDITASKGDELIIIELKTSLNLTLLVQATARQKISDSVYIAVPKPKSSRRQWLGIQKILKRLELGLLTVEPSPLGLKVRKLFDPSSVAPDKRKNQRMRRAVLEEIAGRSSSYNIGGSNKQKLMTAYREAAIYIACCLAKLDNASPKKLKTLGCPTKTGAILNSNHYGWFIKVARGVYGLSELGKTEPSSFKDVYTESDRQATNLIDAEN